MRKLISSGSPYEPKVGISRAVRVGNVIAVSGTAPLGSDGRTVGVGDAGAQARRCLEIIAGALKKAGTSLRQVVRTRTLLVRIEDWEAVAAIHGEFFGQIRPANTIMQVSRLLIPIGWSSLKLMPLSMMNKTPNHALQRTAAGHRGCNRRVLWPPSLSSAR
jgi:enamine deaminase RidA (YjgF/YER057c/UK114 family)